MTAHPDGHSDDSAAVAFAQSAADIQIVRDGPKVYRNGAKRVFDILLVLISLPAMIPFIAIMALAVASDGGSPFYTQDRVGRNGRHYRLWKLRTMVPNADKVLKDYLAGNPDARAEWDISQKLKHDPRITRLGHILRRSSMDELPQLWNVLKGDMSLVGPRPMMPEQQALYPGKAYYDLRPGITGPWQVSERNEGAFADRALYDTAYHRDLSLGHDVSLLAATVRVVLRATGY